MTERRAIVSCTSDKISPPQTLHPYPQSVQGTVYIADKVSQFHVVDRTTGEVLATFDASEFPSDGGVPGDKAGDRKVSRLLVGRHQLRVKAINPDTKHESW